MAHHSRSSLLLASAAAVLLLLLPALGARASGSPTPAHAVVQVSIQNFAFSPRTLAWIMHEGWGERCGAWFGG